MGESDDEDLETLRAAALQSLSVKAEVESHPSQPQWKAVGGRSGMGKPFQAMTGFRGGRNPRKPYNRGRGACYNGRGGVSMFGWAEVQQPISRSNLISIIPFNPEDNDSSVPHPSSSVQATAKLAQEEEDQSSVPTKFSRVERSDSESSDEDEKELQDSAEEVEAEAEDPDVILMQDEDSLGKLLDEFEHELQEEQPGTKPDKKPVAPSKKKSTETFRKRSPTPQRRRSPSPVSRNSPSLVRRRSPSPVRRRSPSPVRRRSPSPVRRRSPSPVRRRLPSPVRRRSPSPIRRRSPSPLRRRSRSPSPIRRRSPSPIRRRSPSPIHRRSLSPLRRRSHSPSRRISPFLTQQRSPSPKRRRSPSPLYRGSPGPLRRRSLSPKRRARRSRSTSLEHQRHVFPPHVRKHFSPSRHSLSRSPSPVRRRSPPSRRPVYSRRSPTSDKRWRTPPTQYGSPRRGSRSPQHTSPRLVKKPGSPNKVKNLPSGEINRPKSPVRLKKLPVRRSISPNSRTPSSNSRSSSKSLSLSPPRSLETMRHVAPLVVKNPAVRHTLGHEEDNADLKGSPSKEPVVKVAKVHKQKVSKTKVQSEVVEKNPLLEARRRKFESSAPILVDNKKIRLSKKDSDNSGLSSDVTAAKSVASTATLRRSEPEKTSRIIKEETQISVKENKKNDDLRTELHKRKIERLHKAGNVHRILPTRLVQSALHGVVGIGANLARKPKAGSSTAAVALVTAAVKDATKKAEPKSEGRRVMVVSKSVEASEAPDISKSSPNTLEEGESSKGPVHTRLGTVTLQRSRSRKSSKKVAATTEEGGETHHSHKKKEQRKFRLKRSKRHSSSPAPVPNE